MVTGSRELIREMNRRLVLETVINDGPLSRAAISKKTGTHQSNDLCYRAGSAERTIYRRNRKRPDSVWSKTDPVTVLSTEWLYYHPRSRRGMHRADGL